MNLSISNLTLADPDAPQAVAASGEPPVPRVKLADIVLLLESRSDIAQAYLDRASGEVHLVTEDTEAFLYSDDADEEIPEWSLGPVRAAREAAAGSDRYLPLPTRFDLSDYEIMEDFCRDQAEEEVRWSLLEAITGSGAFSRFREAIRRLDLTDRWERYRERALERAAVEWCERNGVAFDRSEVPWLEAEDAGAVEQHRAASANAERLFNEPVYTHVTWRVRPEHLEEFIAAWNVLGDLFGTLPAPPVEVTLIRRADDPSVFHSIGSWRTLADAQAVSDSEAAIDAVARIAALCSDGEPAVYEVVRQVRP